MPRLGFETAEPDAGCLKIEQTVPDLVQAYYVPSRERIREYGSSYDS